MTSLGLHVLIINSYRALKYPQTPLYYIYTHLFLKLILIYLYFNSGIFSNLYILKIWCRVQSQGPRDRAGLLFAGALHFVSSCRLWLQLLLRATTFPFDV